MIQTGGLAILLGWLLFAALLCVLAFFVLRRPADPVRKPGRRDQA
ncbi:MAG TPA: hypothetical protein VFU36_11060 [Jatrophihabitans sp.]|nr:hypothetical protein [Jatrophihabitans sp.]